MVSRKEREGNENYGKENGLGDTNIRQEENGKASYTMGYKPSVNEIDYSIQCIPQEISNKNIAVQHLVL